MYNPYVVGKHVYLRHPTEEDVNGKWHQWLSNEEITKYLTDRYWPNSLEAQREFFKSLSGGKDRLVLSIVSKEENKHLGIVSLSGINWVHRYANIAIIIGEDEHSLHGVEGFALMLKVAFLRLNLNNIRSYYAASHKKSEALHRLYKFKPAGVAENMLMIDGRPDHLVTEILDRESWLKRNLPQKT